MYIYLLTYLLTYTVNGAYSSSWETNLRATGRHVPHGLTQCYLLPDTSEHAPL